MRFGINFSLFCFPLAESTRIIHIFRPYCGLILMIITKISLGSCRVPYCLKSLISKYNLLEILDEYFIYFHWQVRWMTICYLVGRLGCLYGITLYFLGYVALKDHLFFLGAITNTLSVESVVITALSRYQVSVRPLFLTTGHKRLLLGNVNHLCHFQLGTENKWLWDVLHSDIWMITGT